MARIRLVRPFSAETLDFFVDNLVSYFAPLFYPMAQAPLPPAPDSSKCPGVQESVAKILCARRWVAAHGVCEVEEVF